MSKEPKKYEWESVSVTPEEVKKMLDERPGGRYAGRGDSPWTQEAYEREYGINIEKWDWILSYILNDRLYGMRWWLDYAKSDLKPLVKKYSLRRELAVKAAGIVICSRQFGEGIADHMNRIGYILKYAQEKGFGTGFDKEPIPEDELGFSEKEYRKFRRQAKLRFYNGVERLKRSPLGYSDEDIEYFTARDTAFQAAYLCLRSDNPDQTFATLAHEVFRAKKELEED